MVRLMLLLNRLLRRPRVGGRQSHEAYWQWEREAGAQLVDDYLAESGDLDGTTVLDIGCGFGGKSIAYGEAGADTICGVDLSVQNAIACRDFAVPSNGRGDIRSEFLAGDAACLPIDDGSFDTVIANDVMEHFADPERSLREMVRVIRPGGAIWIFFTPYYSPLGSHLYDFIHTPWCNILLRRSQVEETIRQVVRGRWPDADDEKVEREVHRVMDFYDHGLNRMSVRRFLRLLADFPELRVTYRRFNSPKFGALGAVNAVPLVRELFTGQAIFRLEKAT